MMPLTPWELLRSAFAKRPPKLKDAAEKAAHREQQDEVAYKLLQLQLELLRREKH